MKKTTIKWIVIGIASYLALIYAVINAFFITPNRVSYWIVFENNKEVIKAINKRCEKMDFNRCIDIIEKGNEVYVGINDISSIKNMNLDEISENYKTGFKSYKWKGTSLFVSGVLGFDTIVSSDVSKLSAMNDISPKFGEEIDLSDNIDSTNTRKLDNGFEVRVFLNNLGKEKLSKFTESQIDQTVAIKLDTIVLVMPIVKSKIIDGQVPIYLNSTSSAAIDVAEALKQRKINQRMQIKRIVLE